MKQAQQGVQHDPEYSSITVEADPPSGLIYTLTMATQIDEADTATVADDEQDTTFQSHVTTDFGPAVVDTASTIRQ